MKERAQDCPRCGPRVCRCRWTDLRPALQAIGKDYPVTDEEMADIAAEEMEGRRMMDAQDQLAEMEREDERGDYEHECRRDAEFDRRADAEHDRRQLVRHFGTDEEREREFHR